MTKGQRQMLAQAVAAPGGKLVVEGARARTAGILESLGMGERRRPNLGRSTAGWIFEVSAYGRANAVREGR